MAGFSIDEVRDTFEADISSFLTKIEAAGNALLACNALAPLPPSDSQGFALLGDLFHTLYGTSMLVGARSLAETAGRLERLSESGAATLLRIANQQREVRELARVCVAGAQEMRGMLRLELEHESDRAKRLAQEFERNSLRAPSQPSRGLAEGSNEFDFQPKGPLTAPPPPGIEQELLIVFREEATDAAAHARRHLEALRDNPSDVSALGALERLFHKLKGAAAGVGWDGLRDRAAELQARLESMLDGSAEVSVAGLLPKLAEDASSLLVEAGLPPLVIAGLTAAPDDEISYGEHSAEPGARGGSQRARHKLEQMFRHELASSADTLKRHLQTLLASPEDAAAASEAEKIFMSLKGAAGSAGLDDLSQLAARLQADAESVAVRSVKVTLDLVRGLAHRTNLLFARAGLDPSSALPASGEHGDSRLIHDLFAAEARQILERATLLLDDLKSASHWRAAEPISELGRLFHHLRGSALVSNEEAVAACASHLQGLCEGEDAQARLPEIRTATEQLAAQLAPAPGAAARIEAEGPPQFPVVREAVEVTRDPALWDAFSQECMDLLEQLDASILRLDSSSDPKPALQALFRLYHTLKGTVGTVGLAPLARALHLIEDFLEESLDAATLPPLQSLQSFFLSMQTDIRRQLAQCRKGYIETSPERIRAAISGLSSGAPALGPLVASVASARGDSQSRFGSRSGDSREQAADDLGPALTPQIRVAAERLDQLMDLAGELVVSRSRLMTRVGVLQSLERELGRNNERLLGVVDDFRERHEFTSIAGARPKGSVVAVASADVMREAPTWGKFSELELDRYDDVNVLSRSLAEISDDIGQVGSAIVSEIVSFADDSDAFGMLVTGIQNEVTRARMVALSSTFTRLSILARDAADQAGKEIQIELEGENVSLDKAVADALFAPMLHLVRNAVAHGIEPARAREGAGKPRRGTIVLSAREDAGQVVVEVRDDGQGFDLEALHRKGVEMGLIDRSVPPSDPRVRDLVFQPGVTTQKRAGRISGRGIGCDVVRHAVERLNGSIAVNTRSKVGTSFVLLLPITLAISNALLVRNAGRLVAIPLYFSERILDPEEVPMTRTGGVYRIELDNVFVKVHSLAELFGGQRGDTPGPLVVLRLGQRRCVLSVDALVGQEEIVVKSTGGMLAGHPLLAGVSIRGTGDLVLVLDVPALVEASAPAMPVHGDAVLDSEPRGPVEPAPDQPSPPARLPDALTLAGAQRLVRDVRIQPHIRALFVDDSLSVRKVAEKTLRGLGVDVVLAIDGVDALAKLRESEVDIVFTDLEMPRMHGYDLIRELRFVQAYRSLPVIVVSSRSGNKHKQQATELGATDYLIKPFSPEIIREALDRHCSGPREPIAPQPVIVRTT